MEINIPGIDAEKALDLYDDDFDIFLMVLRSYAANTPMVLDRLRSVSAETLADYAANVHGVKGTSANIGAEELRKAALKQEGLAKAGDLSSVLSNNNTFLSDADTLLKNINKWLEEYDSEDK
ncbi:MAG: Hpt domain-containing protein [Treponema sp.]|nr:Hpt domain-containing protein [Treponema sp.]